jgi:hypothetical protein
LSSLRLGIFVSVKIDQDTNSRMSL